MMILKLKSPNPLAMKICSNVLGKGKIIIYPTETCYGLGADATNPKAVRKIYQLKNRAPDKKLSIIVSDLEMMKKYLKLNKTAEELIKKYMPGALTIIVENKYLPKSIYGKTVAVRISSNKIANAIVKSFGKPITATSANYSGEDNPYSINECVEANLAVDAGRLSKIPPTTIYDTLNNKILRQGKLKLKGLE